MQTSVIFLNCQIDENSLKKILEIGDNLQLTVSCINHKINH